MVQKSRNRSSKLPLAEATSPAQENDFESIDALADTFHRFMRPFFERINPILHSTVWRGKRFTEKHIVVMMAVHMYGPLSPSELSRAFRLQKGSLTTIIRGLCQSGMIERQNAEGDERSYRLTTTPLGAEFVEHMADQRRAGFRHQFALLPEAQRHEVRLALDTLVKYLGHEASE